MSDIRDYLTKGPATSKEIQAYTGLSQSVVSRKLKELGDLVIKIRNGRAPKYAIACSAFGGDDKLPLVMVDAYGNTTVTAIIRPLLHGGFFIEPVIGMPSVLLGDAGNGLYEDLPYFLSDLCPQGFLGRQIAGQMAEISDDFPPDPRVWTSDHIGRFLMTNGDDMHGNLKFGEQARLRIRKRPASNSESEYPELADSVISGEFPGSSAGGEQPKFATYCKERSSHVIVKFSPKGENEVSQRWRDVLITEYHATKILHAEGFAAAETQILEKGGRLFLESKRFDRIGEYGRMSMVSLQSIDNEFTGIGFLGWPKVLHALHQRQIVSFRHVFDVESLWCFGKLINNTDMHLGNLSFSIDGDIFKLLPVYDMCSMGFAPKSGGEVRPYDFTPQPPRLVNLGPGNLQDIKEMAYDFWERVRDDSRISNGFKEFLDQGNPIDRMA